MTICDGRDDILGRKPDSKNTVTIVTTVTGSGGKVKGAYLRVEIAARQYNPYPLTFVPRRTLAGWGERLCLSPLPNGECQSLGGVQGALFKGQPCWGGNRSCRGNAPQPPRGSAIASFDGRRLSKVLLRYFRRK